MADNTPSSSLFLPTFLQQLANPDIKTVMVAGCGGGFDFVHSMTLYPELKRLGKQVVIGSYSFVSNFNEPCNSLSGKPTNIKECEEYRKFPNGAHVMKVTAKSKGWNQYAPEVNMCGYLDSQYPKDGPHFVYAYYAREFTVKMLQSLYEQLIKEHNVDALIIFDGGSDSLMVGDEKGLGDPIEDCVSVTTAAQIKGVGFGADRFNDVSDCSSMRAVAELTKEGAFWGCVSIEQSNPGYLFYRDCVKHIYDNQYFRSVLTGYVYILSKRLEALARGCFGYEAFDVEKVAQRCSVSKWIKDCDSVKEMYAALRKEREELKAQGKLKAVENLPTHEQMCPV